MIYKAIFLILGLFSLTVSSQTADNDNRYNFLIGDFNGDGFYDFVRQRIGRWAAMGDEQSAQIFLSGQGDLFTSMGLRATYGIRGDMTNLYVGDFNGDGKDDLLRQEKDYYGTDRVNTAFLLLSNGRGGFVNVSLSEDLNINGDMTNLYVGDFNGDGKDDILRQKKGAFTAADYGSTADILISFGTSFKVITLPEDYDLHGDRNNLFIGDFDGDGKDDILRQSKAIWGKPGVDLATVFLSRGEYFDKIILPELRGIPGYYTTLHVADFNGDGRDDILRREKGFWAWDDINSAYLMLSNGQGDFDTYVLSEDYAIKADNTNIYIGDFNGDGKDDFLRQEKGDIAKGSNRTLEVFLSNGTDFQVVTLPEEEEMRGELSQLFVGDFNGDNNDDFIQYLDGKSVNVYISNGDSTFEKLAIESF